VDRAVTAERLPRGLVRVARGVLDGLGERASAACDGLASDLEQESA
jgi:hypothetical protein